MPLSYVKTKCNMMSDILTVRLWSRHNMCVILCFKFNTFDASVVFFFRLT